MDGHSELFRECLMQMVEIYMPSDDGAVDICETAVAFPSILSVNDSNTNLSNSCLILSPTDGEREADGGSQTSLDRIFGGKM